VTPSQKSEPQFGVTPYDDPLPTEEESSKKDSLPVGMKREYCENTGKYRSKKKGKVFAFFHRTYSKSMKLRGKGGGEKQKKPAPEQAQDRSVSWGKGIYLTGSGREVPEKH